MHTAGLVYHEKYGQYDLGSGHPYRGDRFINAISFFKEHGLLDLPNVRILKPKQVSKEDLLRIHDDSYVNLIFRLAEERKPYDVETPVSPSILEAALYIIGGAIEAGRSIYDEKVTRAVAFGCGFHHAGRNYGGGFCLFNDIAVLIEFLRETYRGKRFLILDHDVHFGNGTSDIYYEDPSVLFISLHQDPKTIYPGTGFIEQIGKGEGEGFNVNVPLPPGTGDATYLQVLKEIFVPLALEFKPDIIISNGGSDPHFADLLGNLSLTVDGFFRLSRIVRETTEKICRGRWVLMPGSGYNPQVLPACWYALSAGAAGLEKLDIEDKYAPPVEPEYCRRTVHSTLRKLRRLLKPYWSCFR